MNIYRNILISLSLIMCLPVFVAVTGIVAYMNDPSEMEYLFRSAFMILYSSILWPPYIIMVLVRFKKLTLKVRLLTFIPFVSMLVVAFYIDIKGMPW